MVWTLVYIILTQGGAGSLQTDIWDSGLVFDSQPACIAAADKAAPDLMKARSTYNGPSGGIAGPNPNAITVQPLCLPAAK
jgi:hypothetical protein